jgi:asparagine synthase (glutamine-hydrolysing)
VCGIVGYCGGLDAESFGRALDLLAHRGPDDAGCERFTDPGGAELRLGHRRLAVIDPTPNGHQPMFSADRMTAIVYNGEVYNYRSLRAKCSPVRAWRSDTDTEVILQLFSEHGPRSFVMLEGMFAFALLDRTHQRLYLVRDQFGIKPLYYWQEHGRFAFASEIKSIRALTQRSQEIDLQALYHYFSFFHFPQPQTAYRNIRQIEAGCYAEYDLRSGNLSLRRYYEPPRHGLHRFRDIAEAATAVRSELARSVQEQMVADVPLGAFLSGGMDSTAILGLMSAHSQVPAKTFTIRFEGAGSGAADESDAARRSSEYYGSDHHEIEVDISRPAEMFDLIEAFDQPFGNPTLYLSYLVSRETRRHVTVALSGAGGDELFGGYPRYKVVPYSRALSRVSGGVARMLRAVAGAFPERDGDQLQRRAKLLLEGLGLPAASQYLTWTYFYNQYEKAKLLTPQFRRQVAVESEFLLEEMLDRRALDDAVLDIDVRTFLPNNILEYSDRTGMAVGLEVRVPYVTKGLYEIARSIPAAWRTGPGRSKRVLHAAVGNLIPIANRSLPKTGFCPPMTTWMESLDSYFDTCMTREHLRGQGILEWDYVQRLRQDQRARRRDNSVKLFGLIMFDVWWRRSVEGGSLPDHAWARSLGQSIRASA